jgi:hypothetical protein
VNCKGHPSCPCSCTFVKDVNLLLTWFVFRGIPITRMLCGKCSHQEGQHLRHKARVGRSLGCDAPFAPVARRAMLGRIRSRTHPGIQSPHVAAGFIVRRGDCGAVPLPLGPLVTETQMKGTMGSTGPMPYLGRVTGLAIQLRCGFESHRT